MRLQMDMSAVKIWVFGVSLFAAMVVMMNIPWPARQREQMPCVTAEALNRYRTQQERFYQASHLAMVQMNNTPKRKPVKRTSSRVPVLAMNN